MYRHTIEGVSTAMELPFGTTRELKFINSFYCLIPLFCGAESETADPQGEFPLCHGTPNKCMFTALERSTTKCASDYLNLSLLRSSYS